MLHLECFLMKCINENSVVNYSFNSSQLKCVTAETPVLFLILSTQ